MIQRYNMIQTQFGMIARAYDDGDIYKVSEVDPIIAKLEAENDRLKELLNRWAHIHEWDMFEIAGKDNYGHPVNAVGLLRIDTKKALER